MSGLEILGLAGAVCDVLKAERSVQISGGKSPSSDGSIGGAAAKLALESIRKVEVLEYPELGMEAVWKIEVENFPAFIITDDKGNDMFDFAS